MIRRPETRLHPRRGQPGGPRRPSGEPGPSPPSQPTPGGERPEPLVRAAGGGPPGERRSRGPVDPLGGGEPPCRRIGISPNTFLGPCPFRHRKGRRRTWVRGGETERTNLGRSETLPEQEEQVARTAMRVGLGTIGAIAAVLLLMPFTAAMPVGAVTDAKVGALKLAWSGGPVRAIRRPDPRRRRPRNVHAALERVGEHQPTGPPPPCPGRRGRQEPDEPAAWSPSSPGSTKRRRWGPPGTRRSASAGPISSRLPVIL